MLEKVGVAIFIVALSLTESSSYLRSVGKARSCCTVYIYVSFRFAYSMSTDDSGCCDRSLGA